MVKDQINNIRQLSSSTSSSNESNEIEGGSSNISSTSSDLSNDKLNSTTSSAMTTPSQSSDMTLNSIQHPSQQLNHSLTPSFPTSLLNFLTELETNPTNLASHLSSLSSLSISSSKNNKSIEQEAIIATLSRLAYRLNKLESGERFVVETEGQGTINLDDKVPKGNTIEEVRQSCSQQIAQLNAAHANRIKICREQVR